MSNSNPLLREYLEVVKQMSPLQNREKILKDQVRDLGPGKYQVEGLGMVAVSKPSEEKLKGTELKFDATKFAMLPVKKQSELQALGIVKLENVYQQASASKVTPTLSP